MTLRKRLLLIFATYLAIGLIGGALALRITSLRNDAIREQKTLIDRASVDRSTRSALLRSDDRLDRLRTEFNILVFGTLGAALLTTLVSAWLVRRWVTSPVRRLIDAVHTFQSGYVGVIAPYGPPEIATLAREIDNMRVRMNRALFDERRARETIEQSASVVLTLRSQLESDFEELPEDWTVAARLQPAEGVVAGDCYDIVRVTPGSIGLVVVDISGHGAVSGILALRCKELLRAGLRNGLAPDAAVGWAADQLDDLGDEMFLSAFVAVVDLATGRMRYANAGHPPALVCSTLDALHLDPTGPIVGPFEGSWAADEATIAPGDALVIYTDGLVEVRNEHNEEYGLARLVDLACGASCDEADVIAKRCIDEISTFSPGRLQDDVTVVLLCRGPRVSRG